VGSAIMADRYAYIPSIGFFIFFSYFLSQQIEKNSKLAIIIKSFIGIYVVFLIFLSFNRCKVWRMTA